MRRLTAALGVAGWLLAAPAAAETAAQALEAFGLVGTWSPDCAGPIRVTYALHPGGAPTSTAIINGVEQAVGDIQEAARLGPDRIRWTGIYRKYLRLDVPPQAWMPRPGEIWQTVLQMAGGRIRSLEAQQKGGGKVLVRDGFYYVADNAAPGEPVVWHKTGEPTPFFGRCPAAVP